MRTNPTDSVAAQLKRAYALLEEASAIDELAALDLDAERGLLEQLSAEQGRRLRLAVIGEFSTGKSTFINAILHQDLLPARFIPTTRQVMCIRHSSAPPRVSQYDDGDASDADSGQVSDPPLVRPLSRQAVRELAESGRSLELALSIPAPWSEFDIYDTPGVNDATSMSESVIFDLMDKVDVVVMMLRAQQPLTASEADFIAHLVRRKDLDKFFFNVNFYDTQPQEQAEASRAYVADTLGNLRNWPVRSLNERVFLCSARQALEAALGLGESSDGGHPNQHDTLLAAVHGWAKGRREALLAETADGLLRTVAESAAGKLDAVMSLADDQDQAKGRAILGITQAITDFRVAIREDELALRQRISDRKAALLRDVATAFDEIEQELDAWIETAPKDDLAGDAPVKRLRMAMSERLPPLVATFRDDLGESFADLDRRIAPLVARTSNQLHGLRQSLDLGPALAGTTLATAGYLMVSAAVPWVLGATGALAVTAGLASLIPGVGATMGALLGAGLGAAATSVPRMLAGLASGAAGGYRWLRDQTRHWQEQRDKAAYRAQLKALITTLRQEIWKRLDDAIDPAQIVEGVLAARFPESLLLEERRLIAERLERNRLRDARHRLAELRDRFIEVGAPLRTHHD